MSARVVRQGILGWGVGLLLALTGGGAGAASLEGPDVFSPIPTSLRSELAHIRTKPHLNRDLEERGLSLGVPIFVRIFKLTRQLEVWIEDVDGRYSLFRTYGICDYSGGMGPKHQEGDLQSPEGFYTVDAYDLNPNSQFHLSFNLGFPNAYDRAHGRTGNLLMVHGSCLSRGCFAMTDARMEEIYTLAASALEAGQTEIPVHIFPFKMTDVNIQATRGSAYHNFWVNLKDGHDLFEETGVPPTVWVENKSYRFAKREPLGERMVAATLSSDAPATKPKDFLEIEPLGTPCGAPQCPLPKVQ